MDLKSIPGETAPDLLTEIIDLFLEQTPQLIAQIHAAAEKKQVQEIAKLGHTLKGSAGNVGALRLQAVSDKIEMLAGQDETQMNVYRGLLAEEFDCCREALLKVREGQEPPGPDDLQAAL